MLLCPSSPRARACLTQSSLSVYYKDYRNRSRLDDPLRPRRSCLQSTSCDHNEYLIAKVIPKRFAIATVTWFLVKSFRENIRCSLARKRCQLILVVARNTSEKIMNTFSQKWLLLALQCIVECYTFQDNIQDYEHVAGTKTCELVSRTPLIDY